MLLLQPLQHQLLLNLLKIKLNTLKLHSLHHEGPLKRAFFLSFFVEKP